MPTKKKRNRVLIEVGKLVPVTGWMSADEKAKLKAALKNHAHIDGQSDFINRSAEALIHAGNEDLAQPLRFLTSAERDKLKFWDLMVAEKSSEIAEIFSQSESQRFHLNEPAGQYKALAKVKKEKRK